MQVLEAFSLTASAFSVMLALFAIWLAFQQRRESAQNYESTKEVLAEIEKVMEKTELLVSENFQNLPKSITDQQAQMLESLKPRPTRDEKMADLMIRLADEPDKLDRVVQSIAKVTAAQQTALTAGQDAATLLLQLMAASQQQGDKPRGR